jgi:hypothetical protein
MDAVLVQGMALTYDIKPRTIKSGVIMAKPNYSFEKRQKELAKKKKQEEKRKRRQAEKSDSATQDSKRPE